MIGVLVVQDVLAWSDWHVLHGCTHHRLTLWLKRSNQMQHVVTIIAAARATASEEHNGLQQHNSGQHDQACC